MQLPAHVPLWVAMLPPAAYLLGVAALHLRGRPTAVAGGLDLAALWGAVAALAVAGPLDLVQPLSVRGPWRLVLPAVLVALLVALALLASRPRVVVYNASIEQLRPLVAQIAAALDPSARWAGETVALPGRGLQVHLDGRGTMRCVSLVAVGTRTSPEAWAEFGRRVRRAVGGLRVRASPWAALFGGLGAVLVAVAVWLAVADPFRGAPVAPASPSTDPLTGAFHAGPRRPLSA